MPTKSPAPAIRHTASALLLSMLAACQATPPAGGGIGRPLGAGTQPVTRGAPLGAPAGESAAASSSARRRGAPLGAPPAAEPVPSSSPSHQSEVRPSEANGSLQDPFAEPLRKVVVPGGTTSIYDPPNRKVDPLLSPNSRPSPWQDHPELARRCAAGAINKIVGLPPALPLNPSDLEQTLDTGTKLAKLRHEQAFEVSRFNAQQSKIAGYGARINRTPPEGARRVPRPERTGTIVDRIPQAQDDLAYNQAVLKRREAELRKREAGYVEQLAQTYQSTAGRIVSASPQTTSLDTINRIEALRFEVVIPCMMRALGQGEEAVAVQKTRNMELAPFSQLVLVRERGPITQAIRAAKSTADLAQVVQTLLPSPRVLQLAQLDPEINSVLKERTALLERQETMAREKLMRDAAAEQAQAQKAQRQEFLMRAEKNIAPTPAEIVRLFRDESMRASKKNYARVSPIGDNAFETIRSTFFGEIKSGELVFEVRDITCKPHQRKQQCSLVEQTHQRLFSDFGTSKVSAGQAEKLQVEFHWTANGLQSNYTPWVLEYSRESASSSQSDSQKNRQRDEEIYQARKEVYDMGKALQHRREDRENLR